METIELLKKSKEDFVWFGENYKSLQASYVGKYVAIKNKRVIESDFDYFNLLEKLREMSVNTAQVLIKKILSAKEILVYHA